MTPGKRSTLTKRIDRESETWTKIRAVEQAVTDLWLVSRGLSTGARHAIGVLRWASLALEADFAENLHTPFGPDSVRERETAIRDAGLAVDRMWLAGNGAKHSHDDSLLVRQLIGLLEWSRSLADHRGMPASPKDAAEVVKDMLPRRVEGVSIAVLTTVLRRWKTKSAERRKGETRIGDEGAISQIVRSAGLKIAPDAIKKALERHRAKALERR